MATKQTGKTKNSKADRWVVLRCYYAGVHFGRLVSGDGERTVVLADARRLWNWAGAKTLSEVATAGIDPSSKVSCEVSRITIHEVHEQIECTPEAVTRVRAARWP